MENSITLTKALHNQSEGNLYKLTLNVNGEDHVILRRGIVAEALFRNEYENESDKNIDLGIVWRAHQTASLANQI